MIEPYELLPVRVRAQQYLDTPDVRTLQDMGAKVTWSTFGPSPRLGETHMKRGDWLVEFSDTGELKIYSDETFQARFRKVTP